MRVLKYGLFAASVVALCAPALAKSDLTMSVQNASPTLTAPANTCAGQAATTPAPGDHGTGAGSMTAHNNSASNGAVDTGLMASTADKCGSKTAGMAATPPATPPPAPAGDAKPSDTPKGGSSY